MEYHALCFQNRFWDARLSPLLVRLLLKIRRVARRRWQRVVEVDVAGAEPLRLLLEQGAGLLLAPNHPSHADPVVLTEAIERLGRPLHVLVAWHTFAERGWLGRWLLQHCGCFSVDREGNDLRACKRAVRVLTEGTSPLVVFPEGEVYHVNDRITPFREGPATIAVLASRQCERPIYVVPCAIKYRYVQDPTAELEVVMDELEQRMLWQPQTGRPLAERVYAFAELLLGLKELEYLKEIRSGPLPGRIRALMEHVLSGLEADHGLSGGGASIPERVKHVRRVCLDQLAAEVADPGRCAALQRQLGDAFLVLQLFSYPGDYVAERPTIERLAETVDKFEEDVLSRRYARVRGTRRAVLEFGAPIAVQTFSDAAPKLRRAAHALTGAMEEAVQGLLTGIDPVCVSGDGAARPGTALPGFRAAFRPLTPAR